MPELVVIVPSRGRPHTVAELAAAFGETCTADTALCVAIDESDPKCPNYMLAIRMARSAGFYTYGSIAGTRSMGEALACAVTRELNVTGGFVVDGIAKDGWNPEAIAFMGDDHRPRTKGWDRAYLGALKVRPGIVYGNDLLQGQNLPTQCAISTSVVRALGHMAPPTLQHLYFDNYWLTLGRAAGCLTYLPDVVVEHVHPFAGKAPMDAGYERVNRPELYAADRAAFEVYWSEFGERDVRLAREAVVAELAVAR